ncbi:hypothetical protein CDAR_190391 [Caerostris darwini]|uniref:Uncharacterized protein n=1 Tax=Caerostris darwini TaxID=1538125 RepID=A0AAV4MN90_9ARAC|nr:hypothetical protein CDAR_190391 [Caerostris darwini]
MVEDGKLVISAVEFSRVANQTNHYWCIDTMSLHSKIPSKISDRRKCLATSIESNAYESLHSKAPPDHRRRKCPATSIESNAYKSEDQFRTIKPPFFPPPGKEMGLLESLHLKGTSKITDRRKCPATSIESNAYDWKLDSRIVALILGRRIP